MPHVEFGKLSELSRHRGEEIGVSDWLDVTQERIDLFAEATGDDQWIHVDPQRAARESPFGGTIAHGFLTLSLLAHLVTDTVRVSDVTMGVNYGLNRVRFTAPIRAGQRIRARISLMGAEDIPGGAQLTWNVVVEMEGAAKPACVAEMISRHFN